MNPVGLSWRYLWSRPLATLLNLLLLTLGLGTVAFVLLAQDRLERAFDRDLQGIDLVVGAKGLLQHRKRHRQLDLYAG